MCGRQDIAGEQLGSMRYCSGLSGETAESRFERDLRELTAGAGGRWGGGDPCPRSGRRSS